MSSDPWDAMRSGVMGKFWIVGANSQGERLEDSAALPGHVRLENGFVRTKIQHGWGLDSSVRSLRSAITMRAGDGFSGAEWVFGVTEAGPILLPGITSAAVQHALGGVKVSTLAYKGECFMLGQVAGTFGPRVTMLRVELPFPEWAGLDPMSMRLARAGDGVARKGLEIKLAGEPELDAGQVGGIGVRIHGNWAYRESSDDQPRTSLRTGLEVITTSRSAKDHSEHVEIAMGVQDLLSLAYEALRGSW